jgi:alpha-D-xyloside xylohydrolase
LINKIIHNPYGKGNPYVPGPEERVPRKPSCRDNVRIGVVTEPADKAADLIALVSINGEDSQPLKALWKEDTDTSSSWTFSMPQAEASDKVEYRFKVGDSLESESFTYSLDRFECPAPSVSVKRTGNILYIEMKVLDSIVIRSIDLSADEKISFRQGSPAAIMGAEQAEILQAVTGITKIEICGRQITVDNMTGALTISQGNRILYSETEGPEFRLRADGSPVSISITTAADAAEKFFGFGERFNSLDQRGNVLDIRVYEEYKSQNEGNRTYLPVPFFLSSAGWGHCINSPLRISYDLRAESAWSFEAELVDWNLEYHIYHGNPEQILKAQAGISGYPVLPPDWAFGPWMSSNEWNSQERVLNELNKSRELDIPASVLVIEAWSDEKNFYIWNDAEYEVKDPSEPFNYGDFKFPQKGLWPDPKAMADDIHSNDTKLILWQIPVSKHLEEGVTCRQNELDKQFMIDKGYCVRNEDGTPYKVKPWWFTDSLVIDFTNPEASQWWMDKRRYLIDELHVDGFKTDGGEHLWGRDLKFADGRTGAQLWNEYPNHYIGSYYKYINEKNGGITFSRSGFMGVQSSPIHWAGDQDSTWDAHRSILRAVLNSGISGVPFMGWDIGGFSGEIPSAELYLRSTAFACFGSIMQYHSEFYDHRTPHVDRTPWNIAERTESPEVIVIYRYFAKLRMDLIPYIKEEAEYCRTSGSPLMRFMFIDYPDNPDCWEIEDQYMFGRDLLVCPILNEGETCRNVYLPEGEWFDFFTADAVEGGKTFTVDVPLNRIPVFRRKNDLLDSLTLPPELEL